MKIAIMQPYFFPYIGYFQLVNAVDKFIFYDDVAFIKQGWINRNRILINGADHFFTLSLKKASSFKRINEIEVIQSNSNLLKKITLAYSKAPYFKEVYQLIQYILDEISEFNILSKIAEQSVKIVSEYLNINVVFETASEKYSDTHFLSGDERLFLISKNCAADTYINPFGGKELYSKNRFLKEGINLFFIKSRITSYPQFKNQFVSGLSIIDVMMFNPKEEIKEMIKNYQLE